MDGTQIGTTNVGVPVTPNGVVPQVAQPVPVQNVQVVPQQVLPQDVIAQNNIVVNEVSPQAAPAAPVAAAPVVPAQVNTESAPIATIVANAQAPVVDATPITNEKAIKATGFFSFIFQFIALGFSSIFRYGTNAFNPNSIIDNTGEQIDDSKKVAANAKALERIELRKNNIRDNPKYIEMKAKLTKQMAESANQKYEAPVVFQYIAMNQEGKIVKGKFNGVSLLDVNAFLINEGLEVYSIETSDYLNFMYGQSKIMAIRMSTKDLIFWLTQLSTYLKAGIPLADAVRILSDQMSHGRENNKTQVFKAIVYELSMGTAFSKALEKQGNVFPSLLINMLKAAEATGDLESTLDEMAQYYSESEATKQEMKSAMTYPILVMVFAIGITVFILTSIVPKFVEIYDSAGVQLSSMTQFLIDLSGFLQNYIVLIIAAVVLIIITIVVIYKNVKPIRRLLQTAFMHFPIFGNVVIYNEITLFTKTFASLLKNNVYITESIDILSKVTTNEIYKEIMFNTISNIARGEKISESFKDQWAVPEIAYFMIQTGESTGDLGNMMQKVSEYYGSLHKSMVESMKAFIEPAMIGFIAVVVGGILVAVIMPMFDLYNNISM